jgi:hypothetical protein
MTPEELTQLEALLRKYRDDAADREEWDKREAMRFEVAFELETQT